MKVLSLTEPCATLIKERKKTIETRNWKTNYRGELYIHASTTKIPKEWQENKDLMELVSNTHLNYGYIICKCTLIDCIYMTKEFIEKIKQDNYQEYICGKYKEGRYAWILENVIPLEKPIKAKGQLNIWNYHNEQEIMQLMEKIKYGYIDYTNKKHNQITNIFPNHYILQAPKETLKNEIGVCWDQVELERHLFKNHDWNIKTYFLVHYDNDKCPTHTFLTYEKNNRHYWFEHSWEKFKGIHEYKSKNELLKDVKNKFIKHELKNIYTEEKLRLFEYKKPKKYHITVQEFYKHCENGIEIKNQNKAIESTNKKGN